MDVNKALRELHEEKRRLDITIAALEARLGQTDRARSSRRGRKSMSPAGAAGGFEKNVEILGSPPGLRCRAPVTRTSSVPAQQSPRQRSPAAAVPSALKKPQPEVLFAGPVAVTRIETAAESHVYAWRSENGAPSQVSSGSVGSISLPPCTWNLKSAPGRSSRCTSLDVVLDNLAARNMLKHDGGKCEVERDLRHHC